MRIPDTAATIPPLPSIFDLGRQLAALEIAHRHQDAVCLESRDDGKVRQAKAAMVAIGEQALAIRDLMVTMSAQTLADAAVQLAIASDIATNLAANEHTNDEVEQVSMKLEAITLSAWSIVAASAGIDVGEMNWASQRSLRTNRFLGLEAAA